VSQWTPCKRRDFIQRLRQLGFDGPFSGTRHQFMVYKQHRLVIPSNVEYSIPQLRMMTREVEEIIEREITVNEWNRFIMTNTKFNSYVSVEAFLTTKRIRNRGCVYCER
jgi:hypothetical protein